MASCVVIPRHPLQADSSHLVRNMSSEAVPLSSSPAAGQLVEHEGKIFTTIKEGGAYILVPPNVRTAVDPQAKAKAGEQCILPYSRSSFNMADARKCRHGARSAAECVL